MAMGKKPAPQKMSMAVRGLGGNLDSLTTAFFVEDYQFLARDHLSNRYVQLAVMVLVVLLKVRSVAGRKASI